MNNIETWGDIKSLKPETVKDLIHMAYTCIERHNAMGCSFDLDIDPDNEVILNVELRFELVDKENKCPNKN